MKTLRLWGILGVITTFLYSCQGRSTTYVVDSAATVAIDTPKLTLIDENGTTQKLVIDTNIMYCAIASWCPYSRKLISLFNDPKYDLLTKGHKIVLIFQNNEISLVQQHIKSAPKDFGIDSTDTEKINQFIAKLENKKKGGQLTSPDVLADIPNFIHYYYIDSSLTISSTITSYPSTYNNDSSTFDKSPFSWFKDKCQHITLIKSMYSEYKTAEN